MRGMPMTSSASPVPSSAPAPAPPVDRSDVENLTREEAAARAGHLQVTSCAVDVDLRDAAAEGQTTYPVRTRISFTSSTPGAETFLDYLGSSVESVVLNGETLDVAEHAGAARIRLPRLQEQNEVELHTTSVYSRSGEGLHRFVDPTDGQVYLYTQYEPADSRRVFPVFEQPDLKTRFRISITGPDTWQLRSNGAAVSRTPVEGAAGGLDAGLVRVEFSETPVMSSYITALLAGPYHCVESTWRGGVADGEEFDIPLALLCRASLAEHLDAEELFDLTRRGLDFFHAEFAHPYPWGSYDQAFVPEYNLGAMENPGLVTFTEKHVFDTAATDAQHETRANTLMHEMAHMWFGDLVTPQWWDDLWLKESFADYMGALAVDEATGFTTSWISFANGRKAWAYVQDQLPTTHPIVADIADLEAADQNFDGITYAKGASVLKQLAATVGREAFRTAARRYFSRHAFGNATLQDFLAVLEEVSGEDMGRWAQAWLQTAGVPELAADVEGSGTPQPHVLVTQTGLDPATERPVSRPHRIRCGVHALDAASGELRRADVADVRLSPEDPAGRVVVEDLQLPAEGTPRLLLPNEDDLTYAKLRLDAESTAAVLTHPVADPLARATVWAALWSMVRDGELPARRFVEAVMELGLQITEVSVVQSLLRQADRALQAYVPAEEREALQARFADRLAGHLAEEAGGDRQRAAARTLAAVSRRTDAQLDLLAALLDGDAVGRGIEGLEVDEELRWAFLQALTVHGRTEVAQLDAELESRTTARGRVAHRLALSARPHAVVKENALEQAISGIDEDGEELSNDHLTATVDGFCCGPQSLIEVHDATYFAALEDVWRRMSQGQATRVVSGLFPGARDLAEGQQPEEHPAARQVAAWLDEHPQAPAALRRILREEQDHLLRGLRAQQAARS